MYYYNKKGLYKYVGAINIIDKVENIKMLKWWIKDHNSIYIVSS